ncbi:MAG: efflux RND transporter periplasmic adaptor subunit [Halioglobus sp.]
MATKSKQAFLSVIMLAAASAVTLLLYMARPSTEVAEPEYQPVTVDVAEVVKETVRIQVQAQGSVTPLRQSNLLSEVSGRVLEVSPNFNVGSFVSAEEVLLRIDPSDYEAALLRARAAVEQAESALIQEKGRAEVALREWEKLPSNSQRSPEARDLYLRKPQLEQAQAQLLAAQADLVSAEDKLERTVIRSPYDALVSGKHSDLGQYVSPGSRLADIFSVETAEVRLPIPQSRLDYLELPRLGEKAVGAPIDLYTDVGGEVKHWTAKLHRTEGVFDERSRSLYAVARVDDPYSLKDPDREQLRIGTFINANIQGRALENIVPLPRYVLRAGNFVWVVDDNKRLRNRKVTLLRTGGDTVYVSAGLDNGDLVSLTTLDSSFESAEVEIQSRTLTSLLHDQGERGEDDTTPVGDSTVAVKPDATQSGG